jgi:hypothetical protein
MIRQILPNNNKKCYRNFSQKFLDLNTPLVEVSPAAFSTTDRSVCMHGVLPPLDIMGFLRSLGTKAVPSGRQAGLANQRDSGITNWHEEYIIRTARPLSFY